MSEQELWMKAVEKALQGGPLRFTYKGLKLMYILSDTGHDVAGKHYPSYRVRVERDGKMFAESFGAQTLKRVLEDHPLDRFISERKLDIEAEQGEN